MSTKVISGPSVSIVGGSIGGLCAGVALHAAGCDVNVYERRPETLGSRGAGIVVQHDLLSLIEGSRSVSLPTTSCSHRRTVDATGRVVSRTPMPQEFTSWEAIYRSLRSLLPEDCYHQGIGVGSISTDVTGVDIDFEDGSTIRSDLMVCADGAHSQMREALGIEVAHRYAGYVAWRGTVPEAALPSSLIQHFDDAFVFCEGSDGGHELSYFIPGDEASVVKGQRRLNWVWYETIPEGERLVEALTGADGIVRKASLPPGAMAETAISNLRSRAKDLLDHGFAEMIAATDEPFLQMIEDQGVETMVRNRAVLLGDAAFVVRPHTAGATAKAAADAIVLAQTIKSSPADIDRALQEYDRRRIPAGQSMTGYGIALGRRSVTTKRGS